MTTASTVDPPPEPRRERGVWIAHLVALCVGVIGLFCALALPFAPVWTEQTEVHWPAANEPAESTTALFTPYRPATFEATVACRTVRGALDKPDRTIILSTLPPGSDRDGMVLATSPEEPRDRENPDSDNPDRDNSDSENSDSGEETGSRKKPGSSEESDSRKKPGSSERLQLFLGQREIPLPPLDGDCALTVRSDSAQSVVTVSGHQPITLPGVAAPEIFTFGTDLAPDQAAELSVTARTFSWFDTEPTAVKSALIANALWLAALSLVLLFAHARPSWTALRRALPRRIDRNWALLLPIDAVVAVVLATWLVIGPLSDDDGFAMMTIRMYEPSGDIGNYYRWFNASETPFTLLQHLMRWVSEYSLAPAWLRVPSVVAGGLTWLVVSRGVVAPMCRGTRRIPLHLVTAVFFLACWLPFGVGIRPESFIALGAAALVATLLKATSHTSRAPFAWLGTAALLAGLTVAITPTGVTGLLTVGAFVPRIVRLISARGVLSRWLVIPTRVVLLCCVGAVGLVAMFADSTWNGVKQATAIHNEFGPSLGWYQEIGRFTALLGTNSWGSAGKRLAVFLVVTAMLIVAACVMRQVHRWTRVPDAPLLLAAVVSVFAALWVTPSKWTHHFGALAGVGPALLAVTVVLLARLGGVESARREARLVGVAGLGAASVAAALAFMGPNSWWQYSDIAMPWSDTPVSPDGFALDSPFYWITVAVIVGIGVGGMVRIRQLMPTARQRFGPSGLIAVSNLPSTVLSLSALASVVVLLATFLTAPQRMGDRFTVAGANWDSVTAQSCGIEPEVETLPLAEGGVLRPVAGEAELDGFTANEGLPSWPPDEPQLRQEPDGTAMRPAGSDEARPVSAAKHIWGSLDEGPATTGSLTTPWFELPRVGDHHTLSVWVAGRPEQGNSLNVEFGTATGKVVKPVGIRELRDPPPTQLPFDDPRQGRPIDWRDFRPWRLLTIEATDVPPGTDRIRLHAEDTTTDEQGWLAVSGPVIREIVPLRDVVHGQAPALVDWPISFLFPCRFGYPRVTHGTADSPGVLVTPPAGEGSMAFDPAVGGVFTGAMMTSRRLETPSRLRNAPGVVWGHVYSVSYDRERDTYDLRQDRVRGGGADGDGEYPFEEH